MKSQDESIKFHPCVLQMEQVSDDELDHAAEEDSDKEDQDLDKMFGAWLGELDKLTQVTHKHVGYRIVLRVL